MILPGFRKTTSGQPFFYTSRGRSGTLITRTSARVRTDVFKEMVYDKKILGRQGVAL